MNSLTEVIQALRSNQPLDLNAIREPLADLFKLLEQSPTHQFDDPLEAIVGLLKPVSAVTDPMQAWVEDTQRQLAPFQAFADSSPEARDALRKLFGLL